MKPETLTGKLIFLHESKDRGKLSHLQRWWSPATRHYAYPAIASLAGGYAIDDAPICIVAALFAEHPLHSDKSKNFGTTCRDVAGNNKDTFESHFRRLLTAENVETDLAPALHRIVKRAKKENISINYSQLYDDLDRWQRWNDASTNIKTQWAKEFWSVPDESQLDIPAA